MQNKPGVIIKLLTAAQQLEAPRLPSLTPGEHAGQYCLCATPCSSICLHIPTFCFLLSQAPFVTSLFSLSQEIGMSHAGVMNQGKNALKLHVDFGFKELKIFAKLTGEKCWARHKLGYLVLTAMDFQPKLSCAPAALSLPAFAPFWETLPMLQARILPVLCSSSSSQEARILQELLHAALVQILLNMNIQGNLFSTVFWALLSAHSVFKRHWRVWMRGREETKGEEGREGGDTSGALRNLV